MIGGEARAASTLVGSDDRAGTLTPLDLERADVAAFLGLAVGQHEVPLRWSREFPDDAIRGFEEDTRLVLDVTAISAEDVWCSTGGAGGDEAGGRDEWTQRRFELGVALSTADGAVVTSFRGRFFPLSNVPMLAGRRLLGGTTLPFEELDGALELGLDPELTDAETTFAVYLGFDEQGLEGTLGARCACQARFSAMTRRPGRLSGPLFQLQTRNARPEGGYRWTSRSPPSATRRAPPIWQRYPGYPGQAPACGKTPRRRASSPGRTSARAIFFAGSPLRPRRTVCSRAGGSPAIWRVRPPCSPARLCRVRAQRHLPGLAACVEALVAQQRRARGVRDAPERAEEASISRLANDDGCPARALRGGRPRAQGELTPLSNAVRAISAIRSSCARVGSGDAAINTAIAR